MRLRGGAEDADGAEKKEAGEGETAMEDLPEEVDEERVLGWKAQNPDEYEPIPMPAHWIWIKQIEEYYNEMFGPPETTNAFRQGNLAVSLNWNCNTSMVQKLSVYATMKARVRGNFSAAEHYFKEALELDPEHIPTLCNYANLLYVRLKEHDRAEAMYKKALELRPDHATLLCNYGTFLKEVRNDTKTAEDMFTQAFKADPKHEIAAYSLSQILKKVHNDTEQASKLKRLAKKNNPARMWPKFRHALLKYHLSDGCEVLYRCSYSACKHNIQNEAHQTRTCTRGHWLPERAKFTPKHKRLPWAVDRHLYDPLAKQAILATHAESKNVQIPNEYYAEHKRPSRPTRYRGESLLPKP